MTTATAPATTNLPELPFAGRDYESVLQEALLDTPHPTRRTIEVDGGVGTFRMSFRHVLGGSFTFCDDGELAWDITELACEKVARRRYGAEGSYMIPGYRGGGDREAYFGWSSGNGLDIARNGATTVSRAPREVVEWAKEWDEFHSELRRRNELLRLRRQAETEAAREVPEVEELSDEIQKLAWRERAFMSLSAEDATRLAELRARFEAVKREHGWELLTAE